MTIRTVLFDLGKVLRDWDPRHRCRRYLPGDDVVLERLLADPAMNHEAARVCGPVAVQFTGAAQLRCDLETHGVRRP